MRPAGLPSREDLAAKPHATRLRYISGCRCVPCRAANSRYESERAAARRRGEGAGIVSSAPARAHILKLSRLGVGYKSVADAASVARSIVAKVRSGARPFVRASTLRRLLAVDLDARADAATVPAGPSWRLVAELLGEGYTRGRIALELEHKRPALQLGRKRVLARTAARLVRVHRRLME